jgi:protein-S-isoprenylcysteine O-methyltransferase Ste14
MNEPRSLLVGTALILAELAITLVAAYAVLEGVMVLRVVRLSVPSEFGIPAVGLVVAGAGFAVIVDTFRYRDPRTMLASTSVTLRKMFGRAPVEEPAERTEPFVAVGPYRYSRNPMYLGVVLIVFGAGLLTASPLLLLWSGALLAWYWFVLIPFEERELLALFGEGYAHYRAKVPKFFPYRRAYSGDGPPPVPTGEPRTGR